MRPFTIGEEVLYDGERFVITTSRPPEPYEFTIARSGAEGAQILWANSSQLKRISQYVDPKDDTSRL